MRAWKAFVEDKEKSLGNETAERWLRTLVVTDFDAGNLYLKAKDSFQVMWFNEHIRPRLHEELLGESGRPIKVHISVGVPTAAPAKPARAKKEEKPEAFSLTFDELDPSARFDSFVFSEEDRLTHKILVEFSGWDLPEPTLEPATFNPIYISGPSGSGKSHLLMATTHALRERGVKALYARAESFTQHVVSAIREGEMHRFRNAYRNLDVLLLDNVHLFSRKGATQEELFHTFNTLHVAGRQIILAANCAPQELQQIEPRLVSRFEWGIALQCSTPSQEHMQQILLKKCEALDYPLEPKVEAFLLEKFGNSTISLTRALDALVLRAHLNSASGAASVAMAQSLLEDLLRDEEKHKLTADRIIGSVAEHFGIRSEDVLGKSQRRECVTPRKIAMYLCRKSLRTPFVKIGDRFGRDHSTVMSSVKAIEKAVDGGDSEIAAAVNGIEKQLKSRGE